jgi:hypothetical protein
MLRRYETIFISRAELPSDEAGGLIDLYTGIIEGMDGTVIKVENWGKRRLAYPLKKGGWRVCHDRLCCPVLGCDRSGAELEDDDIYSSLSDVKLSDKVDMAEIERNCRSRDKEEA